MQSVSERNQSSRLTLLFLLLAAALLVSMAAMYEMARRVTLGEEKIVAKQDLIDQLRETLSTIKDAETGQRGYVLTVNPDYLAPYAAAREKITAQLAKISAHDLPDKQLEKFKQVFFAKFAELDETIQMTSRGERDAALRLVQTNEGETPDGFSS